MGWLFVKKDPEVSLAGKMLDLSDLDNDPFVQFQKRHDPWMNFFFCFALPAIIPYFGWGDDAFAVNVWLAILRYVLMLHATWAVNSFAHLFGGHPYDENSNPAENPVVSLFAVGEGWHNWHHKYPFDYAASELGVSKQFNPTKLFIDIGAKFGIVTERRRMTHLWAKREAMILKEKSNHHSVVRGPSLFKSRYIEPKGSAMVNLMEE